MHGTGIPRWQLECSLSSFFVGNATELHLQREDSTPALLGEAIQSLGTSTMGSLRPSLSQRSRRAGKQESRIEDCKSSQQGSSSSVRGGVSFAKPEKEAKVPKGSQRVSGPQRSMRKKGGLVSPTVGVQQSDALEVEASSLHCPKVGEAPPCVRQASSIPSYNPVHDSVSKPDNPPEPVSQNQHLLSYAKWMSTLVPSVLRTRTPFSAFLSKSIQLSYGAASGPIAPTVFPLPIPDGYCHVMPAGVSSTRRRAVHLSRTLHTIVMALNFWHSGGSFPDDASLQRAPNSLHRVLYRRIRSLLKSDGPALAFETTKAGRRFPELYARLGELSEVLTANGVSSNPYAKSFAGVEVLKDDSKMPELRPYRDLDPSRLKLSGTGHFDATMYLSDPLVLPYREPRCLQSSLRPGVMPPLRDSQQTLGELASVWDSLGLLHLHREELDPNSYVRIFNAYKSEQADRQIGDRRGANALESRISVQLDTTLQSSPLTLGENPWWST